MTDQNLSSIDWKSYIRINSSAHQPISCLGFQTYFTKYLRKTLGHVFEDFQQLNLRSKGLCLLLFQSLYRWSLTYSLNWWIQVVIFQLSSVLDSNLQWDIELHRLEVHVVVVHYQRHMWDSKLSSVTIVRFTTNRVILTINLYLIVKLFTMGLIRSSLPRFSFGTICFITFLGLSYLVSFIFPHLHDIYDCVFNLNPP